MPLARAEDTLVDKNGKLVSVNPPLNLHIGGQQKKPGWMVLNALDGEAVDFVGDCKDLSAFPAGSCAAIYCSHVLEHLSHQVEVWTALEGFLRVLRHDGQLLLSVPDMDVLCDLYRRTDLTPEERHYVMMLMFGGQIDAFDYHKIGFNFDSLEYWLRAAGFQTIKRVDSFGLFEDTSERTYLDRPISLNVVVRP